MKPRSKPVIFSLPRSDKFYCKQVEVMKYLNVAEKNDAAKNIAAILSGGNSGRREGLSKFNKIYEFNAQVFGENCQMTMTSVSGHLLNFEFSALFRNWQSCNPLALFDAPMSKTCQPNMEPIKKTLEREIRSCQGLIIWTDCDREGENIGFEIIKVCSDIKPNLRVYRAKFSEITAASVFRALNTLGQPNKNVSDAVEVRMELDLRTGAAFTRLQTLRFQRIFPQTLADKLISYGSCQFPTLGFVVERYQAIENFIAEPFWRIKMNHTVKELTTDFQWKRDRLFDKNSCVAILDDCKENPTATVESVESKPKSKWRPVPLDTVEMEKTVSRKLRINAKETMKIAEKLYTQGAISYPRTETNIFPKELNLANLVEQQQDDAQWGPFARRVMADGGPNPRQGKKSDQAHPPIHPTKYVDNLQGNDKRVYEYIVRHFLACVHKDAQGFETIVNVDIAGEKFIGKGLIILEKNYLDVYIYEKWNAKEINNYEQGDTFMPTTLEMTESTTSPPKLLTEADLIALMEKHGIGTDATHAEHIETIKSRDYVGLNDIYFVPGTLGMGLVEGYNNVGLEVSLAKPTLRADFEKDLKLVCEGLKDPESVRRDQIAKYKAVFRTVVEKMGLIDNSLAERLEDRPQNVPEQNQTFDDFRPALKCPKCGNNMVVRTKKDGIGKFITCVGYPACKNTIWLPNMVNNVEVTEENCPQCGPPYKLLKFTFRTNPFPGDPNPNTLCIGGCNDDLNQALDINLSSIRQGNNARNNNSQTPRNAFAILNASQNVTQNNARNTSQSQNDVGNNGVGNNAGNNRNPNNFGNNRDRNNFGNNRDPNNVGNNRDPNNFGNNRDRNNFGNNGNNFGNNRDRNNFGNNQEQNSIGNNRNRFGNDRNNFGNESPDNDPNFRIGSTNYGSTSTGTNNRPTLRNMPGPSGQPRFGNNTSAGDVSRHDDVVCQCDQQAVLLTVRKDGPNKGKKFYKCALSGCNFFLWDPDDTNAQASNQSSGNQNFSNQNNELKCTCGEKAVLRTVNKEGDNKGRQFYCCPNQCKFFKWADEVDNDDDDNGGHDDDNQGGRGNWRGGGGGRGNLNYSFRGRSSRGRGKQNTSRAAPYTRGAGGGGATRAKRKCGRCGTEGHTRNLCPN